MAPLHQLPEFGQTSLHKAVIKDDTETVCRLVENNPSFITEMDTLGFNSLHLAAMQGNDTLVSLMLETVLRHGEADCFITKSFWSDMPLIHTAACNKLDNAAVVDAIARHQMREQVNVLNRCGQTALHVAAKCGNERCVIALLDAGCNVKVIDRKGNNAVDVAVLAKQLQIAEYLRLFMSRGVDRCKSQSEQYSVVFDSGIETDNQTDFSFSHSSILIQREEKAIAQRQSEESRRMKLRNLPCTVGIQNEAVVAANTSNNFYVTHSLVGGDIFQINIIVDSENESEDPNNVCINDRSVDNNNNRDIINKEIDKVNIKSVNINNIESNNNYEVKRVFLNNNNNNNSTSRSGNGSKDVDGEYPVEEFPSATSAINNTCNQTGSERDAWCQDFITGARASILSKKTLSNPCLLSDRKDDIFSHPTIRKDRQRAYSYDALAAYVTQENCLSSSGEGRKFIEPICVSQESLLSLDSSSSEVICTFVKPGNDILRACSSGRINDRNNELEVSDERSISQMCSWTAGNHGLKTSTPRTRSVSIEASLSSSDLSLLTCDPDAVAFILVKSASAWKSHGSTVVDQLDALLTKARSHLGDLRNVVSSLLVQTGLIKSECEAIKRTDVHPLYSLLRDLVDRGVFEVQEVRMIGYFVARAKSPPNDCLFLLLACLRLDSGTIQRPDEINSMVKYWSLCCDYLASAFPRQCAKEIFEKTSPMLSTIDASYSFTIRLIEHLGLLKTEHPVHTRTDLRSALIVMEFLRERGFLKKQDWLTFDAFVRQRMLRVPGSTRTTGVIYRNRP